MLKVLAVLLMTASAAPDDSGPSPELLKFLSDDLLNEDTEGFTEQFNRVVPVQPSCEYAKTVVGDFLEKSNAEAYDVLVLDAWTEVSPVNSAVSFERGEILVTRCIALDTSNGETLEWIQPGGKVAPGIYDGSCSAPESCTPESHYKIRPIWVDDIGLFIGSSDDIVNTTVITNYKCRE